MRARAIGAYLLALLAATAGCSERERPAKVAAPARPALRLVAITDLAGYLEPCGCQSRPLGGIDKAAAKLEALREDKVPLLLVSAGDLLFGPLPEGASDLKQAEAQETWKAEALVGILNQMGLAAAAPGPRDLNYGPEVLQRLQEAAHFQWLPGAPAAGAAREGAAGWLGDVSGIKVGVVGVSLFDRDADLDAERLRSLTSRAQAEVDKLRGQGAQLVLTLLSSDQRTGRRLSGGLQHVDFAIQGGIDAEDAPPPSRAGDVALLRAAHQGQGLLVVDLYLDGRAVFADVSDWTRKEQSRGLEARIADLAQRVAAWERDPSADKASVNEQRSKLAQLRAELKTLSTPPAPSGNAFRASFQPLTVEQRGDPQIGRLVDAYDARVNDYNHQAFADVKPAPVPPGAAHYVGSASCQSCHAPAYAWWTKHAHGRAYTTLENVHKQFNLSCVGCHVTGYGKPGGAALVQNEGLTHVGCESCHGAGSAHVSQPAGTGLAHLTRVPTEAACKQCHTPDHSDLFEYSSYVARLRAPGHGMPATAAR